MDSEVVLRQLFNIGVGLAAAFARVDGELSASVLTRLEQNEPFLRVIDGQQQIPWIYAAVFTQSTAPAMAALRERYLHRSFHDADLELCVRAAERYGTRDWLLAYGRSPCSVGESQPPGSCHDDRRILRGRN